MLGRAEPGREMQSSPLAPHSPAAAAPRVAAKGSVTHMDLPPMSNSVGLSHLSQLGQLGGRAAASPARHEIGHSVLRTRVKQGAKTARHSSYVQPCIRCRGCTLLGEQARRYARRQTQGAGIPVKRQCWFFLLLCPNLLLFASEMHWASVKPARENRRRQWEHGGWKHKVVLCFSGWKEAQVIK